MQASRPQKAIVQLAGKIRFYEIYIQILTNAVLSMVGQASNVQSSVMPAHMHDLFYDSRIFLRVMIGLTA